MSGFYWILKRWDVNCEDAAENLDIISRQMENVCFDVVLANIVLFLLNAWKTSRCGKDAKLCGCRSSVFEYMDHILTSVFAIPILHHGASVLTPSFIRFFQQITLNHLFIFPAKLSHFNKENKTDINKYPKSFQVRQTANKNQTERYL